MTLTPPPVDDSARTPQEWRLFYEEQAIELLRKRGELRTIVADLCVHLERLAKCWHNRTHARDFSIDGGYEICPLCKETRDVIVLSRTLT